MMNKDTATTIIYKMVAQLGTLEQRMAMDVLIVELGYKQLDANGMPVITYSNEDLDVEIDLPDYWKKDKDG